MGYALGNPRWDFLIDYQSFDPPANPADRFTRARIP
jgi:hypothetical protein